MNPGSLSTRRPIAEAIPEGTGKDGAVFHCTSAISSLARSLSLATMVDQDQSVLNSAPASGLRTYTKAMSPIDQRIRHSVALMVAAILAASPFPLTAQEIGDVVVGERLAKPWCSTCHVVTPSAKTGTSTGVPTFAAIAALPSTTSMSLRAFLQTPHARMPDLHLSHDETDDLVAYILSLRGRRRGD
jgi:mono/diheme cytochrome c family protein